MGWNLGFDSNRNRWVGYAVPAYCDQPGCKAVINRGLSYVCGGDIYGGERGCGLFFCSKHILMHSRLPQLCDRCSTRKKTHEPKVDHPEWIKHLLKDKSWAQWRIENPKEVEKLKFLVKGKHHVNGKS